MKKILSLFLIFSLMFSMASVSFAYDKSENIEGNVVSFTVKREYSGMEIDFMSEFADIKEIESIERGLPILMEEKLMKDHPDYKSSYTIYLNVDDKDVVYRIIDEISKNQYIAYAQPAFVYDLDVDDDEFFAGLSDKIYACIEENDSFVKHNSKFYADSSHLELLADYGEKGFAFVVENDIGFGMDEDVRVGSVWYNEGWSSVFGFFSRGDEKAYTLTEAYESKLIDDSDLIEISKNSSITHRVGDVNCDDTIDIIDVSIMRKSLIGDYSGLYLMKSDLNNDGSFDIIDIAIARNIIING